MSVIQVSGLVKNFGNFQALAGLNMSVEEGTIHGVWALMAQENPRQFAHYWGYYIQPPVKSEC